MSNTIVRAAIHPAIGIARAGNAKDEFYIGPEVSNPPAQEPGFYRIWNVRFSRWEFRSES